MGNTLKSHVEEKISALLGEALMQANEFCQDQESVNRLWGRLDGSGNDFLRCSELMDLLRTCSDAHVLGPLLNRKQQVAYAQAIKHTVDPFVATDGSLCVRKKHFPEFIRNAIFFDMLFRMFLQTAKYDNDDKEMDFEEFTMVINKLSTGNKYIPSNIDPQVLVDEFAKLDNKGGGTVFFGEFISYVYTNLNIEHM